MIMSAIALPLGYLMSWCYTLLHSYGWAIVLFTLLTKVILFPVSLWVHRNGITMVRIMPQINRIKIDYFGDSERIAEEQHALYKREGYHPLAGIVPMVVQLVLLMGVVGAVNEMLDGANSVLALIPATVGGWAMLMPVAAGLAALALSVAQSRLSPLQREQSKQEKLVTGAISVGISLLLGGFVAIGVGIYWISGNLLSIVQQLILNQVAKPARYIDYQDLEQSRGELESMGNLGETMSKEDKNRERCDYKRFFSIVNKHLVFYSEKSGFYKYFKNVIEYLLAHSNVTIHYITSDAQDSIFQLAVDQPRIKPYYIGEKKLITLMMKMDADIVVMTTPDLNNLYLKRSYVRKDIEYIYMFHGVASTNMVVRKGAYDHFDTIFCVGQHQIDELRETEEMYGLPTKNLVPCGYGLFDQLIEAYEKLEKTKKENLKILIAPSWQDGNILDSCVDTMLPQLLSRGYSVTVRPHPEYVKRYPAKINSLIARYQSQLNENFVIERDFASNTTIFTADLVVTDWSGIAYEFSYCTLRPCIFIDTPMKVLNPDYTKYKNAPLDISLRSQIGVSLQIEDVMSIGEVAHMLLCRNKEYVQRIEQVRQKYLFHIRESGRIGGQYILNRLKKG